MVEEHATTQDSKQHSVEQLHRNVQKVDSLIKVLDIHMIIKISEIQVQVTGSRRKDKDGNKILLDFGCEDQKYKVTKEGQQIRIMMCGWHFGTYDRFEELYLFFKKTNNTLRSTLNNIIQSLSRDAYIINLINEVEKSRA